MSEQKTMGFMTELNKWIDDTVVYPLIYGDNPEDPESRSRDAIIDGVKRAIREKVLESYKNGCRSGAGHVRKELHNAQAKTH